MPSQSSDSLQVTLQGLMSSTYLGICFDLLTVMYFICRVITISNYNVLKKKKQMVCPGVYSKEKVNNDREI